MKSDFEFFVWYCYLYYHDSCVSTCQMKWQANCHVVWAK